MSYVPFPIETDADLVAKLAFDYLASEIAGWTPNAGNLDVWVIEAVAREAAETRDIAADVPDGIFKRYGQQVIGLAPNAAAPANGSVHIIAIDNAGYLLPAGTQFALGSPGMQVGFQTQVDATLAAGATTLDVPVVSIELGTSGNDIPAGPALCLDALAWVQDCTSQGTTSGGAEAESDDDYRNRLAAELQLLSISPVLPDDFAVLATTVDGVARAGAIDLYDPGPPPVTNAERNVTVVCVGPNGQPATTQALSDVVTLLDGLREVNFVVHAITITTAAIDVTTTFTVLAGSVMSDVEARVTAALSDYLNPATWGGNFASDSASAFTVDQVVRYLEVASVINAVAGVKYIVTLTVNGGSADVTLATPETMPTPGTLSVTAVAG
jgi:uncharacterized phage protein gp47/JayE